MRDLLDLHHVVYIPVIVFSATVAMAWCVSFIAAIMDRTTKPAPKVFRPLVINGGRAATLRAVKMPLRSNAMAAQPYRASFGG